MSQKPLPSIITERKRHCPVSKEDKRTIYNAFKEEYCHQAYTWFLFQNESRREKFISFITGEAAPTFKHPIVPPLSARVTKSNHFSEVQPNLVLHSPRGTININRAILASHHDYKQTYRPNVPIRQTSIEREHIFGSHPLPPLKEEKEDSIALYLVRKFFNPSYAEKIIPFAESGYQFLSEISKILDQRENKYPINPLRSHPTMDPYKMAVISKERATSDHLQNLASPRNCLPPVVHTKDLDSVAQTGLSSYQEATLESLDEKYHMTMTKMIAPKYNPVPFGPFPVQQPSSPPPSTYMRNHIKESLTLGKRNYEVLNGPTIL